MSTRLLLWFYLIFIFLNNTIIIAQPRFTAYNCEYAANYTRNDTYGRNLDATLSALPETNSGFSFFNRTTGQGNDTVHSIAMCQADVEANSCQSCVNDSIARLRFLCPNQKEAVGYYDTCYLKYSNKNILGNTDNMGMYRFLANPINSSSTDQFYEVLRPLLNELRADAAAGGPLGKFASGTTTGPDFATIYGLMQCIPDLSEPQCSACLENAVNQYALREGTRKVGGRALTPMCMFRFEIYGFFNVSTRVIPPPPSPPINQPSQPPGNKQNTTRIVIIVVVTVIVVIIIALLCIVMRLKKKKKQAYSKFPDINRSMFQVHYLIFLVTTSMLGLMV